MKLVRALAVFGLVAACNSFGDSDSPPTPGPGPDASVDAGTSDASIDDSGSIPADPPDSAPVMDAGDAGSKVDSGPPTIGDFLVQSRIFYELNAVGTVVPSFPPPTAKGNQPMIIVAARSGNATSVFPVPASGLMKWKDVTLLDGPVTVGAYVPKDMDSVSVITFDVGASTVEMAAYFLEWKTSPLQQASAGGGTATTATVQDTSPLVSPSVIVNFASASAFVNNVTSPTAGWTGLQTIVGSNLTLFGAARYVTDSSPVSTSWPLQGQTLSFNSVAAVLPAP